MHEHHAEAKGGGYEPQPDVLIRKIVFVFVDKVQKNMRRSAQKTDYLCIVAGDQSSFTEISL